MSSVDGPHPASPRTTDVSQCFNVVSYFHVTTSNLPEEFRMSKIRSFFKSDDAIAVTEYGLLIALVAVVLIAAVLVFGRAIATWFGSKTTQITTN